MIELSELCSKINIPAEVTEKVLLIAPEINWIEIETQMKLFYDRKTWMQGVEELRKIFTEDPNGFKMLTCMLVAGLHTYELYQNKGISDEIYFATFGCFSRFIQEHRESFGCYGFDRDWWTPREIAMEEFRIGELEYEMVKVDDNNVISIHIPSDAKLTMEYCRQSIDLAKDFFDKYYLGFKYDNFICDSWLLAPSLVNVLDARSNILMFQNAFEIVKINKDENEFMQWIFKTTNPNLDELPQKTSLQIKLKEYLKRGGKIGSAYGYLKDEKFNG